MIAWVSRRVIEYIMERNEQGILMSYIMTASGNRKLHVKKIVRIAMALLLVSIFLWQEQRPVDGADAVPQARVTARRKCCCRQRRIGPRRCECNQTNAAVEANSPWRALLDGKSLAGWKSAQFGGEGEVTVEDGKLRLAMGDTLTGVTYTGTLPKTNYEIRLQAMRVEGIDFFCGLTFPVADSHCSLIVGGWAGAVVGLSSIDGKDASENETTKFMKFETGRWYRIRVRVTPTRITAWIDDKEIVDQVITGRRITTRNEVDLSKPLGISAWQTKAALRDIQLRLLSDSEKEGR